MLSFLILLLVTPLVALSAEDDIDYVRHRLREYYELVNPKFQLKTEVGSQPKRPFPPNHIKSIQELNMESPIADALFEGDIMLTREQVDSLIAGRSNRHKRQAMVPSFHQSLWNHTIYYRYNTNFLPTFIPATKKAMNVLTSLTCLRFEENPKALKVLEFKQEGKGCWSHVGMSSEAVTKVVLNSGCGNFRVPLHEICHALGLYHTQARHDRDKYIKVHEEHIFKNWTDQYTKLSTAWNDNLGIPYDYGSIMHYYAYAMDNAPHVAMEAKDKLHQLTMGSQLYSFYDMLMINKLYSCTDICDNSTTVCTNSGYPNSNNCSICICPRGYGGPLCSELPQNGVEVRLRYGEKIYQNGTKDKATSEFTDYVEEHFRIIAPDNMKIRITFNHVSSSGGMCHDGCVYGGIEIKARDDPAITGYRFCCNETVVVSNSSMVPIIVFYHKNTKMSYSFSAETDGCLTSAHCANGGIPDHDKCSVCICPVGFTGALCTKKTKPSNGVIEVRKPGTTTCRSGILGNVENAQESRNSSDNKIQFSQYNFLIKGERGTKVKLTIRSLRNLSDSQELCVPGCSNGGMKLVNINKQKDQKQKFCCPDEYVLSMNQAAVPLMIYYKPFAPIVFDFCVQSDTAEMSTTTSPSKTKIPITTTQSKNRNTVKTARPQ